MITKSGCNIVRVSELVWDERAHATIYWHDAENNLTMQFVDQAANAIASGDAHPDTHATSVLLKGRAQVNDLTLNALDVILDAGDKPRGQIKYFEACQLFRCIQNSNAHTPSAEQQSRIVQSEQIPWNAKAGGKLHMKTLVDRGAGRLTLTAMRITPGFTVPIGSRPHMQAALIVDGSVGIEDETLHAGNFMYMATGVPHGPLHFPDGATLLMVAMRPA